MDERPRPNSYRKLGTGNYCITLLKPSLVRSPVQAGLCKRDRKFLGSSRGFVHLCSFTNLVQDKACKASKRRSSDQPRAEQ